MNLNLKFLAMQTFSEIQKDPKLESNEDGGKYVEIANCVVIFGQCKYQIAIVLNSRIDSLKLNKRTYKLINIFFFVSLCFNVSE